MNLQLVNTISNNINALQALNIQASLSDVIISQIITEKLDSTTRKAWELKLNDIPFRPLKDFITFLEGRRRALENLNPGKVNTYADVRSADSKGDKHTKDRRNTNAFISTATVSCPMCKISHSLYKCDKFCNLTLRDRRAIVTKYNLCLIACKEDIRLVNVPAHIIVSNAESATTPFYIRIAGIKCQGLLRLKQILHNLRKRVRLPRNQTKEAIVVLKNNVHLKCYWPRPQLRSRIHGVFSNLAEFYWTEAHNQVILLKPLHSY